MTYALDQTPQHFATGDQGLAQQQAAFNGAGNAFHAELNKQMDGAKMGFLNQLDYAVGGDGNSAKAQPTDKTPAKEQPMHTEAAAFGLANDGSNQGQDSRALAQNFREMAFTSVYDSAVGNRDAQRGFPGAGERTTALNFNSAQLDTSGTGRQMVPTGQQLRFAS